MYIVESGQAETCLTRELVLENAAWLAGRSHEGRAPLRRRAWKPGCCERVENFNSFEVSSKFVGIGAKVLLMLAYFNTCQFVTKLTECGFFLVILCKTDFWLNFIVAAAGSLILNHLYTISV